MDMRICLNASQTFYIWPDEYYAEHDFQCKWIPTFKNISVLISFINTYYINKQKTVCAGQNLLNRTLPDRFPIY